MRELLPRVNDVERVELPARSSSSARNCGGSDGNSGVTANPALGVASDLLVAQGGTAILGETPEIYGAEHLLTRRPSRREVGEKLRRAHQVVGVVHRASSARRSTTTRLPATRKGGLTTIYEKSLGAIAKGGDDADGRRSITTPSR